MKFFTFIKDKWNVYWFSENMLFNASMARIFIGIAALWNVYMIDRIDYYSLLAASQQPFYQPIGILQLFGNTLPSIALFDTVRIISYVSTFCFLAGLFTRITNLLSILSGLFMIGLVYSWGSAWSHGENVIYLAQLALLCTPSNIYFSVDALLFKKRQPSFFYRISNNGAGLQLAILAIGFMFVNAGFYKAFQRPFLGWIFSDSIRNYIIQQYLIIFQRPIPVYLEWIVNNQLGYKTLAFLNIAVQLSFIGLVVCMKRPWLRILFALLFISECFGLYFVMGLDVFKWTPLAFVFIDWQWVFKKANNRNLVVNNTSQLRYTGVQLFIIVFSVLYLFTAFDTGKRLESSLKPYPFTNFSLFTGIVAKMPLNVHQTMQYNGNRFEIVYDLPATTETNALAEQLAKANYRVNNEELFDTALIRNKLEQSYERIAKSLDPAKISALRWNRVIYYTPAYPEKAVLKIQNEGLIGQIGKDKKCKIFTVAPILEYKEHTSVLSYCFTGYKGITIKNIEFVKEWSEKKEPLQNWHVTANGIQFDRIEPGSVDFLFTITDNETGKEEVYSKLIHIVE